MDYEKVYGAMHDGKQKVFSGYSIKPYIPKIASLVYDHLPRRILDYGSGKGYQYLALRVHEQWGGVLPYCYDPGVVQLRERPEGSFAGIICTDVMEHIEETDVDNVLNDIFSFAYPLGFVFFGIACRPAKRKKLPDGRDVHVTIKPPVWWLDKLSRYNKTGRAIVAEFDEGPAP